MTKPEVFIILILPFTLLPIRCLFPLKLLSVGNRYLFPFELSPDMNNKMSLWERRKAWNNYMDVFCTGSSVVYLYLLFLKRSGWNLHLICIHCISSIYMQVQNELCKEKVQEITAILGGKPHKIASLLLLHHLSILHSWIILCAMLNLQCQEQWREQKCCNIYESRTPPRDTMLSLRVFDFSHLSTRLNSDSSKLAWQWQDSTNSR